MNRTFYNVPNLTVKLTKEIILWSYKNSLKTRVDELNCKLNFSRKQSNKTFKWTFNKINKSSIGFLRIVLDENINPNIQNIEFQKHLEIFIRGIDVNDTEYFLFIFLNPKKLTYLKRKYKLLMIS